MNLVSKEDRFFIERKYHDPEKPFNAYRRMQYHGWEYDPESGKTDEEILEGLSRLAASISHLPHPVQKARAVEYVLQNTRIGIDEHDYFIGFYSWGRLADSVTFTPWKTAVFENELPDVRDKMDFLTKTGAGTIWPDFDHVVPDWASLLTLGFPGILKRARAFREEREKKAPLTSREKAFFDAIEIEYTAILSFLDRLIERAEKETHEKAPETAACLKRLRRGAPEHFYDALQLIYLYFMISESVDHYQVRSLGNGLDHSLFPFYEKDLKAGFPREELLQKLAYFFLQWSAIGNYWGQPFYLGGTEKDGSTRVNALTYDIVRVYRELKIYNPKIQVKYGASTPKEFTDLVLSCIRSGSSSFVFCCEKAYRRAVERYGATPEESLDFDLRGCYETGVRANEVCATTGYLNALKAVLLAMRSGKDEKSGAAIGPETPPFSELPDFKSFFDAFLLQFNFLIDSLVSCANSYDPYFETINPSSLYSATVETSLKNAFDGYQGGVKFNNSSLLLCGFASAVDALLNVKRFVYDEKKIAPDELLAALDADFEGYEALRALLLNSPVKYGNHLSEADEMAQKVASFFVSRVHGRKNGRGGVYKAFCHTAMQFVREGERTGASPDGRKSGEEISKNASPAIGMDRKGVTALILSVCSLSPSDFSEGFCLDVTLHPSAVEGEDGLCAMKGLIDAYDALGGMAIQFNLFDPAVLLDAQEHPEKYRNLQVRVCGWNALWNDLPRAEQNAYLERAKAL